MAMATEMAGEFTFMGRPCSYWRELQERFDKEHARPFETANLLQEIAKLRGRLGFYENRIEQMAAFLPKRA
jgi:hypothetical protein